MTVAELTVEEAARRFRDALKDKPLPRRWLYFIQQDDGGPVKIGVAVDPADRLKTLQQGNPSPLTLLAVYRCFKFEEREIHRELAEHRIAGEWFKPSPAVLAAAHELNDPVALEELVG